MYAFNTNLNLVSGGNNPYQNGNPNSNSDMYFGVDVGPNRDVRANAGVNYHPNSTVTINGNVSVGPNSNPEWKIYTRIEF